MNEDLNGQVTAAILKAEDLTRRALLAWQAVEQAERLLANSERSALERHIAARGVITAAMTVRVLKALDRYSEDEG